MDIKEQILVALGLNKSVKLAWQAKSEDGTIFVSTAETLEAGRAIMCPDPDTQGFDAFEIFGFDLALDIDYFIIDVLYI